MSLPTFQLKTNSSFWLEQHEPGVVDSYISYDYLDVDGDVHFPCLGADPSCVEFSLLDSYEYWILLRKNQINRSEEGYPNASQGWKELMLRVLY